MPGLTPGEIAHFDKTGRLTVPLDLLRSVKWWKQKPEDVVAELVEEGLIRVYLADEAEPLIGALQTGFKQLPPETMFDHIAALADRYRPLKLYGDGRLRVTKDVAAVLGFVLGQQPTVYVQPFPRGFEVMTLRYRASRLKQTIDNSTIDLRFEDVG